MKRQLNKTAMVEWSKSKGSASDAVTAIARTLKCSVSKAEKIASGRYPSELVPLELEALSRLTKIKAEVLYSSPGRATVRAT